MAASSKDDRNGEDLIGCGADGRDAMARYILRFTGKGASTGDAKHRLTKLPDVQIVDESLRMLLVEAPPEAIGRLTEELPGWTSTLERTIPLPDPRPKLRSS
jgi:hypothetical protein